VEELDPRRWVRKIRRLVWTQIRRSFKNQNQLPKAEEGGGPAGELRFGAIVCSVLVRSGGPPADTRFAPLYDAYYGAKLSQTENARPHFQTPPSCTTGLELNWTNLWLVVYVSFDSMQNAQKDEWPAERLSFRSVQPRSEFFPSGSESARFLALAPFSWLFLPGFLIRASMGKPALESGIACATLPTVGLGDLIPPPFFSRSSCHCEDHDLRDHLCVEWVFLNLPAPPPRPWVHPPLRGGPIGLEMRPMSRAKQATPAPGPRGSGGRAHHARGFLAGPLICMFVFESLAVDESGFPPGAARQSASCTGLGLWERT